MLAERTPFRLLDRIGMPVGSLGLPVIDSFLEKIAAGKTEGGWVVIASALGQQLTPDPSESLTFCRKFIIAADVWYAADTFGERVSGPALVSCFDQAIKWLTPWRNDESHWVRRNIGVAVHLWTKRTRGSSDKSSQAEVLLDFLEPMFEEKDIHAVKGIGWALKTLGRYYPDILTPWLEKQIVIRQRQTRSVMIRKAHTYLSDEQRARATGARQ